ncbi:hypothetical protein CMI41_03650 [Candidatus Pacearchaeota archaeon]|nr:hypothetical protein [Candidatus Pacearchaeota archaeon]|tara:strand:+ start:193 stop:528 length:336 start_codon:yes stop_codon:yes gene_type:complete
MPTNETTPETPQEKPEGETSDDAGQNEGAEETPAESISNLEQAQKVLGEIQKANEETRKLMGEMARLKTENLLSGQSQAGTPAPVVDKAKEESDNAVKTIMNAAGFNENVN